VIEKFKYILKNKFFLACALFGIWMIVEVFVGYFNGNNPSYIVSNVTGYLTLSLSPVVILYVYTFQGSRYTKLFTDVLVYSSFILALVVTFFHFAMPFYTHKEIMEFSKILNDLSFGGFSSVSTGIYRIFLRSEIFFQIALVISISRELAKERIDWFNTFVIGVLAFGMLISLTRSFWFGAIVSLVFVLFFNRKEVKKLARLAFFSLTIFSLLIISSAVSYRGGSIVLAALNRVQSGLETPVGDLPTTSNPDNASDSIRKEIIDSLIHKINDSVFIGNGMGAEIDKNSVGGNTEYLYFDLTMKMGIIGLILFAFMFFFIFKRFIDNYLRNKNSKLTLSQGYISALVGVMVSSFFNPYLNNPIGLVFFLGTAMIVYSETLDLNKE
jgi:O-antigen ligase